MENYIDNKEDYKLFLKGQRFYSKINEILHSLKQEKYLDGNEMGIFDYAISSIKGRYIPETITVALRDLSPLRAFQSVYFNTLIEWPDKNIHEAHEYALKLISVLNQHPTNKIGCAVAVIEGWDFIYHSHSGKKYKLSLLDNDEDYNFVFEIPRDSSIIDDILYESLL